MFQEAKPRYGGKVKRFIEVLGTNNFLNKENKQVLYKNRGSNTHFRI